MAMTSDLTTPSGPRRGADGERCGRGDEDERRSVVEEALTLDDGREARGHPHGAEREEHADRVGDRQERTEHQRRGQRQRERVVRDHGRRAERDRDAGDRQREDRTSRLAQVADVGGERALEDEHRQHGDQDNLRVERRARKEVEHDEHEPDRHQRDVPRHTDALGRDRHRGAYREHDHPAGERLPHDVTSPSNGVPSRSRASAAP